MKLKTTKKEIYDSLQVANYFISTSSTLPILGNIHFEAGENELRLTATDMDISAKIKCKVEKIIDTGKAAVNKKILTLIKEFPEGEITIEKEKNDNIKITCKKSTYRIPGLPASDFPYMETPEKKLESVILSHKAVKDMINSTAFAALKDTSKRNLNGVFLRFEGKIMEAVATDAHRLAYYRIDLKDPVKTKFDNIVPLKTIVELDKILESSDEKMIEINFFDKLIEFKTDNIEIISRVIDEAYPNYRQVIPKEAPMKAIVNREDFAAAVRRASAIMTEKAKTILLKLENNMVYISAQTSDEGEAFEELEADYTGESIEVSYNAVYLMDLLKATASEKVEIKLVSSMNPGVLKPEGADNFVYVIMPIRK